MWLKSVCAHKNSAIISNASFALFLRVDDFKRGNREIYGGYWDTSPKPTQVCNPKRRSWFLVCFGLLHLLSSYSPALNVSTCFRIAIFIGFIFVVSEMLIMCFYIDNINLCTMCACMYFRVLEDCTLYVMVSMSS